MQYKQIANFQKSALEALSHKGINMLLRDPEAHTRVPEFDESTAALGEIFQKVTKTHNTRLRIQREYQEKQMCMQAHYTTLGQDVSDRTDILKVQSDALSTRLRRWMSCPL